MWQYTRSNVFRKFEKGALWDYFEEHKYVGWEKLLEIPIAIW